MIALRVTDAPAGASGAGPRGLPGPAVYADSMGSGISNIAMGHTWPVKGGDSTRRRTYGAFFFGM